MHTVNKALAHCMWDLYVDLQFNCEFWLFYHIMRRSAVNCVLFSFVCGFCFWFLLFFILFLCVFVLLCLYLVALTLRCCLFCLFFVQSPNYRTMYLFCKFFQCYLLFTYILGESYYCRWESGAGQGITGNHGRVLWDVQWLEWISII